MDISEYVNRKCTYPYDDLPNLTVHFNPHRQRHITSFGIVAYCAVTDRFLLVQPRYTANYLTLLRGAYRRTNLRRLVTGMCMDELKMIRRVIFRQVSIYDLLHIVAPGVDHDYVAMRFENHESDILRLINEAQNAPETLEHPNWLFPKGRPNRHEAPYDTALREFTEETGVNMELEALNTNPIIGYYVADNDFIYESRYWVIECPAELELPGKFRSSEILARAWVDRGECLDRLRAQHTSIFQDACRQIKIELKLNPIIQ